jgi:hypothetical protein
MSGTDTNFQWFIARDGRQHGPVSDVEIRKLVELAHLKPTDLVWRQGFSDWRAAASVFPIPEAQAAPAGPGPAPGPQTAGPQHQTGAPAPGAQSPGHPSSATQAPGPQSSAAFQVPGPQSIAPGSGSGFGSPQGSNFGSAHGQPGPAAQPYSPFGQPGPGRAPGPDPLATRPLGNPMPGGGPFPAGGPGPGPAGGPRITTDMRRPEMSAPPRPKAAPRKGRRMALVATGLIAMTATGAWLSSQYKDQILAYVDAPENGAAEGEKTGDASNPTANAGVIADGKSVETAATPVANVVPDTGGMDQKLQGRRMWVAIKQQFPERYQEIVTQSARLTAEQKPQKDITAYLVGEIVKIRRENAQHALAAPTARHKELAAAFLANLQELSREGGDGCYEFISRGENSAAILSRIDDASRSAEIETQLVTIVTAIVEGRAQPATHPSPVKTDYDVLAGELGRLGWTQADMRLFANPKELAKAPRERVCSMLKDWFTAHLAIQDPSTQERLLFETLKPVVSG